MQNVNLKESIESYSLQIKNLGAAHKKATEDIQFKEDYLKQITEVFNSSTHILSLVLKFMGYLDLVNKSAHDRGLEVGVLRSTRNWSTLIDMQENLNKEAHEEAAEFFMDNYLRVVKPTFMELEEKAKEYIFLQNKKR